MLRTVNSLQVVFQAELSHGHGHGHGIFILAMPSGLAEIAAIMHPGRLFNIVVHVSWKKNGPKPSDLTATESARVSIIMHLRVVHVSVVF
jgi:hypothetical protein